MATIERYRNYVLNILHISKLGVKPYMNINIFNTGLPKQFAPNTTNVLVHIVAPELDETELNCIKDKIAQFYDRGEILIFNHMNNLVRQLLNDSGILQNAKYKHSCINDELIIAVK